jgi:hypothetical protein
MSQVRDDDPSRSGPLTGEFNALDHMSPKDQVTAEAKLTAANLKLRGFGDSLSPASEEGYNLMRPNQGIAYFDLIEDAMAAVEKLVALETLERRVVIEDLGVDDSKMLNELGSWWESVSKTESQALPHLGP